MKHTHTLYVPKPGKAFGIEPGSAILASADQDASQERVLVYYEGNLLGAENMRTFAERALHAAGRQVVRYPTVAKMAMLKADLIEVGRYHYPSQRVVELTNIPALVNWVPDEAEWIKSFAGRSGRHEIGQGAEASEEGADPGGTRTLVDRLNALIDAGLDFGTVANTFCQRQSADESRYAAAASTHPLLCEGELEVDGESAVVSLSGDGGAYVMAWLWVADEDLQELAEQPSPTTAQE